MTLEERFWAKVDKSGDCWMWTGCTNAEGYGRFNVGDGQIVNAHRVSVQLDGRDIPSGLEVDHLCRNRTCVNPRHLDVVDHRTNMLRSPAFMELAASNARKTHCPKNHPYEGANLYVLPDGRRSCRICCRAATNASYARAHQRSA